MDSLIKAMPVRVQITAILRKALFSGEYKSGDELSLTETAERLGVSRTPVREAFQTLEAEGLIELRMNRGAIVKTIDEKYITDHYEMRILLESEAAKRAAQRGMPDAADYTRISNHWAGLRPVTPWSSPVIQRMAEGLVGNLGHGMLGWTLAMGSGERAVAQAMAR